MTSRTVCVWKRSFAVKIATFTGNYCNEHRECVFVSISSFGLILNWIEPIPTFSADRSIAIVPDSLSALHQSTNFVVSFFYRVSILLCTRSIRLICGKQVAPTVTSFLNNVFFRSLYLILNSYLLAVFCIVD